MTGHDDNLRHLTSEAQLDAALANLHSDVPTDEHTLAEARAQLVSAAGGPEKGRSMSVTPEAPVTQRRVPDRRRRGWWIAAAATFAAVVAGAVVIQAVPSADGPPVADEAESPQQVDINSAADVLLAAASNVDQNGAQPGPGQYIYVDEHVWWGRSVYGAPGLPEPPPDVDPVPDFVYLDELVVEEWVPADRAQEWLERREYTGEREWLIGTEEEASAVGVNVDFPDPLEMRATCGDYDKGVPEDPELPSRGCGEGHWIRPTPQWIDGLPREPEALLERLRDDVVDDTLRGEEMPPEVAAELPTDEIGLSFASEALRSGLLPADVRSLLFEALALMPDIEITEEQANLDGRVGTAIGMDRHFQGGDRTAVDRLDIIVDYETGDYIGERRVALDDSAGLEPGTVTTFTSFDTAIVDEIGERP